MLNKNRLLWDQFAEGVSDIVPHKHLRKCIRENLAVDLFSLRSEAIQWAEETSLTHKSKVHLNVS